MTVEDYRHSQVYSVLKFEQANTDIRICLSVIGYLEELDYRKWFLELRRKIII